MSDEFHPIRGKCTWWREHMIDDDRWDVTLKESEKRVACSCFIEGRGWIWTRTEVPADCPDNRRCRYYIRMT